MVQSSLKEQSRALKEHLSRKEHASFASLLSLEKGKALVEPFPFHVSRGRVDKTSNVLISVNAMSIWNKGL